MATVFDEIVRFNADRIADRVDLKLKHMAASPFAFFRGADHLFAQAWPDLKPADAGVPVLCCGDLHLENFGAYQTSDGDFRYDINDFDESLVAPCSFDLARCTASILLAGEEWQLTPLQANGIALAYLSRYRQTVLESARTGRTGELAPRSGAGPIQDLLNETTHGSLQELFEKYTEKPKHGPRRILRDEHKRPEVPEAEAKPVCAAIEAFGHTFGNPGAFQVLDITGRIAGIGSLGVPRYVVLVEGDGSPDRNRLLDVKQARPSSVASCAAGPQPAWKDDAERIVESQKRLQSKPAAGLAALRIANRPYRLREVIPEESRSKLDRLQKQPDKLRSAVESAGQLTGWSHIRGCESEMRTSLADWAAGPGIDAVLAAAVRLADRTQQEFAQFRVAFADASRKKKTRKN